VSGTPTGHYQLDLAVDVDRKLCVELIRVNNKERTFNRMHSGRDDTSQHRNWNNFRNEWFHGQLNGNFINGALTMGSEIFAHVPTLGNLHFDYVSTEKPPKRGRPLKQSKFDKLLEELGLRPLEPGEFDTVYQEPVDAPAADGEGDALGATRQLTQAEIVAEAEMGLSAVEKRDLREEAGTPPPIVPEYLVELEALQQVRVRFCALRRAPRARRACFGHLPAPRLTQFWSIFFCSALSQSLIEVDWKQKIEDLHAELAGTLCNSAQALQVANCFPRHCKTMALQQMFSRLTDLDQFDRVVLSKLSLGVRLHTMRALGWLNCVDPLHPDGFYRLHLADPEEREMARVLAQLEMSEKVRRRRRSRRRAHRGHQPALFSPSLTFCVNYACTCASFSEMRRVRTGRSRRTRSPGV
jgi:hypothetical protein